MSGRLDVRLTSLAAMLALCIAPLPVLALMASEAVAITQAQVNNRIEQVERLIQKSSAAQQVKQSDQPDVLAAYEELLALFDNARLEFTADHFEEANMMLTQVSRDMFEAARKTDAEDLLNRKRQQDFQNRKSSVAALLLAHDRISQEKKQLRAHAELQEIVDRHVGKANMLAEETKFVAGRKELNIAYLEIKSSIGILRDGDTLVRSLSFATDEEEYRYELDRNDTHRMLVTILAAKKMDTNSRIKKLVQGFLQKADTLREEAEKLATIGNYARSIEQLEASTGQVMRAIRSAGIYIPGG